MEPPSGLHNGDGMNKKVIIKVVCPECLDELKNLIKKNSYKTEILEASGNFTCDWCEKDYKKWTTKRCHIYKEK